MAARVKQQEMEHVRCDLISSFEAFGREYLISFQIVWMMRDFVGPVPEVQQQQKSQREQGHYREYIVKMHPNCVSAGKCRRIHYGM